MQMPEIDTVVNGRVVDDILPRSEWLERFANVLMLLHPETIALSAARHVAKSHPNSWDALDPEDVAYRFIFEDLEGQGTSH